MTTIELLSMIKAEIERRMDDNLAAEEKCKTAHFGAAAKEDLDLLSFLDALKAEAYDPYKTTVESILKMFDSYSITTDKADFIANIRVKCKDAVEYATGKRPVESKEKDVDLAKHYKQWVEKYKEQHDGDFPDAWAIVNHFYDLGCRHTAVMYDDIEYNRQRAEESIKETLEEEISRFIDAVDARTNGRWAEDDILECARHFAEWGAEHLKK